MEARSLAPLNTLAANPPQYPERPNEERHEPLVLYISRVPGTRDIILSPFKPQIKNVTAEDVANSLYYVHLEAPSSHLSGLQAATHRSSEDGASLHTIPRKPLPDSARPLTPESLPGGQRLQPPSSQAAARNRGASFSSRDELAVPVQTSNDSGLGLGADCADPPQPQLPKPPTSIPARKPVASQSGTDSPAAKLSLPPILDKSAEPSRGPEQQAPAEQTRLPSPHEPAPSLPPTTDVPFSLTLIRRDPGSGNQWNVGRVSSRHVDVGGRGPEAPSASCAAPPIDVEIETSGYARFRRLPPKKTADGSLEAVMAAVAEDAAPRSDIGVFSRQVVMRYSRSWTVSLKEKMCRLEQAGRARASHIRNGSIASVDSTASWAAPGAGEWRGMKPRGYVFTSPWNGKCEFRTGHGGRSVQCRHTLHDGEPAAYNPLVAAEQAGGGARSGAATVSELRFNLPTAELLGDRAAKARTTTEQWRGSLNKLVQRPNNGHHDDGDGFDDVGDDGTVSPFELNVGRERAGGGNRGGRAKLGKLIVYNDGLKMLDLVVAANMGVWWKAWEKMF
ncbi:hypothetical protein CDD83_5762 [Cordyceps sp. RAO-2017]|nr:hypothetical protein CDD83_5762 [Cordyceps sp. RAO-2017]